VPRRLLCSCSTSSAFEPDCTPPRPRAQLGLPTVLVGWMGRVYQQRADLQTQRGNIFKFMGDNSISEADVRAAWTMQEEIIENKTLEQTLSEQVRCPALTAAHAADRVCSTFPGCLSRFSQSQSRRVPCGLQ